MSGMAPIPKQRIAAAYHAAADRYDDAALSFWGHYGERTVRRAALQAGEYVLDVCCGSGASAIPAARAVGERGRVIGLDLAPGLNALASQKAAAESLGNIEFRVADFDQVYFRNNSFDAIVCVFGIFFFPDAAATLQKMWRLLRPKGRLAITTWGPELFEPGSSIFWKAVQEVRPDLYKGFHPWDWLTSLEAVRGLIPDAEVETEDRDHPLRSPEDWWAIVLGTGYRGTVEQLSAEEREHVRKSCLACAAASVKTSAVYAVARKQG